MTNYDHCKLFSKKTNHQLISGVLLSFLELIGVIKATSAVSVGQISGSYQNFFICVEMLISAFLLRVAFPTNVYDKVNVVI